MKLIVGLGNPGKKYEFTRHNVGKLALKKLAEKLGVALKKKADVTQAEADWKDHSVLLIDPGSFMNVSGPVILDIMDDFGIKEASDMLVLVDDLHLPLGKIRFRPKGSAGGHNGLASIIETVGSELFSRIRIGIGKPEPEEKVWKEYVLDKFSKLELKTLDPILEKVSDCALSWVTESPEKLMQKFN